MKRLLARGRWVLYFLPRLLMVGVFFVVLVLTLLGNFDALEPYLFPLRAAQGTETRLSERLAIGPYPQRADLLRLKRQGYGTVIVLLDDRLPQERALKLREEERAREISLNISPFPLGYLPVNSAANRAMAARLANFVAAHPKEKIYIHCYLGRHRVGFVRDTLIRRGLLTMPQQGNASILPKRIR
ncbi:hypothetical protein [Geobacter argillaceus]|uniref:Protein tyrosine phosphatase (PTP) superfamily phosphohydrolase (DUF442 family) n=1 Tax=Geobacter argillaceus TaxID=345631 RepID=A0A562WRY0_9BACT|nr:hypothetical protein [Geobacter argillaceus]TWJ32974.1 protein tyrosine phosphatase (PTP) superfamily phosphohydrolase (DUF442 family) [Geobacter argillaceus]